MRDIMVDLETLDTIASAAIVAIGAAQCNLVTGEIGSTFYRVVDLEGQLEAGMTLNPKTLYWWLQQSNEAREAITVEGKISLMDMCTKFAEWLHSIDPSGEKLRLWSNGASFDIPILTYAYNKCAQELPVKFWNQRDQRTVLGFYPPRLQEDYRRNNLRTGTHHNALDDCKHQVKYCAKILQELGVKELY